MAKGKIFDEYLLIEYARRLEEQDAVRGDAAHWFMDVTGVSRGTAYRVREKILTDVPLIQIASAKQKRKKRTNDLEDERKRQDMLIIAGIKNIQGADKRKIPTERAKQIAHSMQYIQKEYSRSTIDRYLSAHGMNAAHSKDRPFAHSLKADYPFHVVAVDATPIDHYYLTLDKRVAQPDTTFPGDKHLDDILKRDGLYKIWVYYLVDMYSKAFLVLPFASLPKGKNSRVSGENADDYYAFLKFCFLPKNGLESPLAGKQSPFRDCPVEGQPTILYCDNGSGIGKSKHINNMCNNLGVQIVTHLPGNPSAKGIVEGRIGAFKRSYESLIVSSLIKNIDQLTYFYQAWADRHNRESGAYDRWRNGIKDMPIIRLTEQNFKDATVTYLERVVNGYGCIAMDNKQFFVTSDESWRGEKIQIFRSYVREGGLHYAAKLGNKIIPLIEGKPEHSFNEFKSFPKSEGAKNREDAAAVSQSIRKTLIFDDILPQENDSKVRHLPHPKIITKEVHSPLVRDNFNSTDGALDWLLNANGLFLEEIPVQYINIIKETFVMLIEETGSIAGSVVLQFSNAVAKYKKEGIWKQL